MMNSWSASVFTLFPEMFPANLGVSVIGNALKENIWDLDVVNMRDFAFDKHKSVDDTAFGGGPGMVLRPDVIDAAISSVDSKRKLSKIIYLSPRGKPFTQSLAQSLSTESHVGFLCGRFEGVDQRVLDKWDIEEISLGDFILAGGEVAAQTVIESTVRLLPDVLGDKDSLTEESFSNGLLEYPQYTRPREWNNTHVPEVLTSGHHGEISKWRQAQSETLTQKQRPDLWDSYSRANKLN